ncbi:hypothetical protein K443DRAFT_672979 [Laccaria amethystina LaAM-08-1]|uniref:Uncharacterized protein n=1 Tax=Laccaria amethystina LaAM-08-1 TaxID=1095629 RepID=A0A0C9XT16_9AGAR|nr:hypothetical protein K443DRAFT_672979 [Laccaria amethystina LaAM-08-1]
MDSSLYQTSLQHVMSAYTFDDPKDLFKDTLFIPVTASLLSASTLFVHVITRLRKQEEQPEFGLNGEDDETRQKPFSTKVKEHARAHGGAVVYLFKVLRFFGCLDLVALSVATFVLRHKGVHHLQWAEVAREEWPDVAMIATYIYTSILALVSLTSKKWNTLFTRHNVGVLLVALAVYLYRDVWPLATYTLTPIDASEGSLLWAKLGVLCFTAAFIPLFIPRVYEPVDPRDPMQVPNVEQTACLFSTLVYTFLDTTVFKAYNVAHLPYDELPPLCDYDRSKVLTDKAFVHLDAFKGAKKRHLFFNLIRVFWKDYFFAACGITGQAVFGFASPLAINRILNYLETRGADSFVRPWFWIMWLFLGPMLMSVSFQSYIFTMTRTLVRCEALLVQLVFDHSLRIRFKAEAEESDEKEKKPAATSSSTSSVTNDSTEQEGSTDSATVLGTEEASSVTKKDSPAEAKAPKKADNLVGKLNNLITNDMNNITGARDFLMIIYLVPLEVILAMVFLYKILGWSAFVGFASIIALIPLPGYIASLIQRVQKKKMVMVDARVQTVTETVGVLRMIKLFGWEGKMNKKIQERREEELNWMWKDKVLDLCNDMINFIIPTITMLITYAVYTLIMKEQLTASKVFSSMSVFDILRNQLHRVSWMVTQSIRGKVSLDRLDKFLSETELLDSFAKDSSKTVIDLSQGDHEDVIGFKDAEFTWSASTPDDGSLTPSSRAYKLRIEGELFFERGSINLIIGPTGSGKTSILMALLGEMHFVPPTGDSWFNLPRAGGVAYAAQESWVQNETIRDNIVFGAPFDEKRYKKVLQQCALERDLELFEAGDRTEVGEKGLTLSGGQKARVTLARAIYSSAEIILLDDILAALDVHTSKHIVDQCFKGDLVQDRTILLVTHNVALASPIANFVVSIGSDGKVQSYGNDIPAALAVLAVDPTLGRELEREEQELDPTVTTEEQKESKSDGKLVVAEEIQEGRVSRKSMTLFFNALSGNHIFFFFFIWMSGIVLKDIALTFSVWFLGHWGSQYETHHPSEVPVFRYMWQYSSILFGNVLVYTFANIYYIIGTLRASRTINRVLVTSVLGSTLRWLDETPTARIITRCTQDIGVVDSTLSQYFSWVMELGLSMVSRLIASVLFTPIFIWPGLFIAVVGVYLGNIYIKAQLSTKREMSNAKSPLLGHFAAAVAGLTSLRAYGVENTFRNESLKRIDYYTRAARTSYNLNRWICVRMDLLGATFTTALATYLVYGKGLNAANTGFSLNMAVEFTTMILYLVRIFNEFEVQANSLERIQGYIDIEQEPKPTEAGTPPASWPTSGALRVEKLSARYSKTGPKVLHDLSFNISSGERIGVVGRTGSGKSSLTLSLLRCILTEGEVYYDGLLTSNVNLDALRSNITIIPQMPELLSGSLRRNLDPFEQHDDSILNAALHAAGLFSLQDQTGEARITLDSSIASGGGNLSVGQRQIIALARAIVRGSKLLILDEATSAIDHKTDSIIQTTLRHEVGADVTVVTIAHRLQTIMDADKILVLDSGKIAEFDTPSALLKQDGGMFKSMVDGSGDRATLYAMVEDKASPS